MKTHLRYLLTVASIATATFSFQAPAAESKLWKQFKSAKETGKEPTLPDFSYAGYNYSNSPTPNTSKWRVFQVGDYGAKPNDGRFDDAGIRAAIDAAERYTAKVDPSNLSKGAIVQFDAGRYKVAPKQGIRPEQQITIEGNNILLRGQGAGASGTTIFIANHMARSSYCSNGGDHCYGIPMFRFKFPENKRSKGVRSLLRSDFRRERVTMTVDDASRFSEGQRVLLWLAGSSELFKDQIGKRKPHKEWENTLTRGMTVREIHTIRSINGNKITLAAPTHITLKTAYNIPGEKSVMLRNVDVIENVGVENIRFLGNFRKYLSDRNEVFQHHKSDDPVHDYGWAALNMNEVFNGWVNQVEFRDLNLSLAFRKSSAITVSNVKLTGVKGHASIGMSDSFGILIKDTVDTAGHHHGFASSQRSAGGVYLRCDMQPGQRADVHAAGPYATLYDSINGGHFWGNGGDLKSHPHHMGHLVAWNFNMRDSGTDTYDFWPTPRYKSGGQNSHVFLNPYFIGLHGDKVKLLGHSVGANESQGKKVEPGSLFEAQLGLRHLPGFTYLQPEGGEKNFSSRVDVAYGTAGKYNFVYNKKGTVKFNNSTFGDPVP